MQYELSTDEFYAYGHLYEPWAYVDTEIVLTDYIEESKLSKAISMAFFRMPYYKVRISVATKPERYVLESNLNEFKVVREDDFLPFTDPRSGDHLITVSFSSRTIRIRISHVLCDAYGMNLFISFLLCAYCEKNEESYKPLELTADRSVLALEYDNPFDHIVPLDEICTIRDVQSFSFEAKEISDTQAYLTQIMIPGDNLLVFAKRNESSVSAVGAWLIMNTIQRVKGKVNMPICIAVPCDMRSIIDCEKNMRNCNTDLKLTMHMKMMDKDPDYQLSCLRSQLFAQMYDRVSIGRMESSKKAWIRAGKLETIKEKIEFYGSDEGLEEIPIVSYAGSLDIGEFNDKVEAFHQHIAISGRAGILCGITYHHGMFEFNISSNLKEWDKYLDAMTLVLKEIKMPAKDLATKILQT